MGPMIETLDELAAAWSGPLFRAAWQGGLAVAAAWALVRCHRGLTPRVACWAWRLVDLKLLVALLWVAPLLLPLLPAAPPLAPIAEAPVPAPDLSLVPAPDPLAERVERHDGATAFRRPAPATVAILIWLAGIVSAAGLAGKGWLAAARLRRDCPPVDRLDLREIAAELAGILGLRDVPELRAGPGVARPMLVGAVRPAILLPVAMLDGRRSMEALRPILAHELAHVRRRDLWWGGLAGLARGLFWFHPLVWLAHREALVAREAACDALAIRVARVRPSEYGRILLEIAAGGPGRASGWAAALGMAGPAGSLRRRLIAMKTARRPSRERLMFWGFTLLVVGAAGIVPWRLVPREGIAQEAPPPVKPSARGGQGDRDDARPGKDDLPVAEARLKAARLRLKAAEATVQEAQAQVDAAAAGLSYREKQTARIKQLVERGAVEERLLDEEMDRRGVAQAQDLAAKQGLEAARARKEGAEAAVREAQAIFDLARAGATVSPELYDDGALVRARAQREEAEHRARKAEDEAARAAALREYRVKQRDRHVELARKGAIEQRLVDEEEDRLRAAQAEERVSEARLAKARASVAVAEAEVHAAEARFKRSQAAMREAREPGVDREPKAVEEARARLRRARLDRTRFVVKLARADAGRAESDLEVARASLAYRTKLRERIKQLVDRAAVEIRLLEEEDQKLTEARRAEQGAEAAVKSARARLEAAEDRLKAVEADSRAASAGRDSPEAPRP